MENITLKIKNYNYKFYLLSIVILITSATILRALPFMYDYGYDFYSTKNFFPDEIAFNYGIWSWIGIFCGFFNLSFTFFWIIISSLFGFSLYFFLNSIYKNQYYKSSYGLNILLFIFCIGYLLPWFGFAHVRYGTAVLLSLGALSIRNVKIKYLIIFLAALIHSLIFLLFFIYIISKIRFYQKYLMFLLTPVFFIIFLFRETIIFFGLSLLSYDNYMNDFNQFEVSSQNLIIIIRIIIITLTIWKLTICDAEFKTFLKSTAILYIILLILTPFSGRLIELLYPMFFLKIKSTNILVFSALTLLILVEAFFSISRVIFHYEI